MRCADSLGLRTFLGFRLTEDTPAHASMTIIRQRLPEAVFDQVFIFGLRLLERKGLLRGKTVAVDATTLEANAAMKSIVGKDTGEDWKEYLRGLAKAEGIENPTEEDLRRLDRGRKDKKVSNEQWESPTDRDSRIAKMKDGRTPLAYKADAQTTERRRRGLGRPFGRLAGLTLAVIIVYRITTRPDILFWDIVGLLLITAGTGRAIGFANRSGKTGFFNGLLTHQKDNYLVVFQGSETHSGSMMNKDCLLARVSWAGNGP
jgi:hypothetical protein